MPPPAIPKLAVLDAVLDAVRFVCAAGVVLGLGLGLGLAVGVGASAAPLKPLPAWLLRDRPREPFALGLLSVTSETSGTSGTSGTPWRGIRQTENVESLLLRMMRAYAASAAETVKFELYTRMMPSAPTRIFARDKDSITKSTFDPKKPTKFVIHGFWSKQGPGTGGEVLKNAFLAAQDCNVVTVDWHDADTLVYTSAVRVSVPKVAAELAELIRTVQGLGGDLKDVHIVGHSLGAQIAGAAGSEALGPAGAGRVTGLDPAGPMFEGADPAQRLDPSDAAFVDVIHTDGGKLGFAAPTGHVDFFPEGGMHPFPGCLQDTFGLCSHCLVYTMMADAVEKPGDKVFRSCESWQAYLQGVCEDGATAVMGINTDPSARGSFFLAANSSVPDDIQRTGKQDTATLFPVRRPLSEGFRC